MSYNQNIKSITINILYVFCISTFAIALIIPVVSANEDDHRHDEKQKGHVIKAEPDFHHEEHEEGEHHEENPEHDENDKHDDHEESEKHDEHAEASRKIGRGKAIVKIDGKKGFRLSSEALDALNISHKEIRKPNFEIPTSALVRVKDTAGVYQYHDHFFKLVPVTVQYEKNGQYLVHSTLNAGDLIVTQGVELLRVADIYSQDTSDYSHGH